MLLLYNTHVSSNTHSEFPIIFFDMFKYNNKSITIRFMQLVNMNEMTLAFEFIMMRIGSRLQTFELFHFIYIFVYDFIILNEIFIPTHVVCLQ